MTDLVVHTAGPEGAPTLLLLHGLTDSGRAWADAIDRWSTDYRVLAPDLLGHGASPRFTTDQLDSEPAEVMCASLVRAVEARVSAPVLVVGHSMGGALAAALSGRRPDLVRAAVLEDPGWVDGHHPFGDPRDSARRRMAETDRAAADLDAEVDRGRRDHPSWPESELRPWAEATAAFDPGFGAVEMPLIGRWREIAAALTTPTLVVTGTELVIIGPQTQAAIAALANPAIEVAIIDGAGHCVRRDDRAAYHALVDPWLASHASGG